MAKNFRHILAIVFVIGCTSFDGVVAPPPEINMNGASSNLNDPQKIQSGRRISGLLPARDMDNLNDLLRQFSFDLNSSKRGIDRSPSRVQNRPPLSKPNNSIPSGAVAQPTRPRSPTLPRSSTTPKSSNIKVTQSDQPSRKYYEGGKDVPQAPLDYSQISRGRPTQYDSRPKSSNGWMPQNGNQATGYVDWPTPYSGQPTTYGSRPRPYSGQPTTYEGGNETTDENGNTVITTPMSPERLREMLKEQNFAPSLSPTAVVRVVGRNRKTATARIMIDTGASECLISQRVAAKLELRQEHLEESDRVHTGIGGKKKAFAAATLKLCSRHSSYCLEVHCDIVEEISEGTDTVLDPRTIPTRLPLAEDGTFETKNPITDILVGAEYFPKLYLHQPQQISGFPLLYKTEFGYVAIGKGELGTRYMILKEEPVVQTTIVRMPANQYY